jgi:DNA (cytosine-5)-methyltransferase 1
VSVYYNEIDPYAAAWLRNLIGAGHIAAGDVDERSIVDVRADDLRSYTQCHFFAGIGGWSLALRLAGWPDDRPVWTGSCPCQPFSAAGAGKAADDERHLWPAWFPLIAERRPAIVFGEQVEAAIGWGWLDAVFADLEDEGYACGTAVLPACGVGAPHIRQRCWFVADNTEPGRVTRRGPSEASEGRNTAWVESGRLCDAGYSATIGTPDTGTATPESPSDSAFDATRQNGGSLLADANGRDAGPEGLQRGGEHGQREKDGRSMQLGDPDQPGSQRRRIDRNSADERIIREAGVAGFWSDAEFIPCTDGKSRPVEPGTFPLAHGIPGRVGRLRAYGNAIVPQVAAEFIAASNDAVSTGR